MEQNYFVAGEWFSTYEEAVKYASELSFKTYKYHVVFTKAEKDSIINAIDHEMECGK